MNEIVENSGESARAGDMLIGKNRAAQRCGQPGQQHGLRIPLRILSRPTSMRRFLVSSFLAEVTQQIHSFRASGVMATQRLFTAASDSMALRKSGGSLWTVPSVIALGVMHRLPGASCRLTPGISRGFAAKRHQLEPVGLHVPPICESFAGCRCRSSFLRAIHTRTALVMRYSRPHRTLPSAAR